MEWPFVHSCHWMRSFTLRALLPVFKIDSQWSSVQKLFEPWIPKLGGNPQEIVGENDIRLHLSIEKLWMLCKLPFHSWLPIVRKKMDYVKQSIDLRCEIGEFLLSNRILWDGHDYYQLIRNSHFKFHRLAIELFLNQMPLPRDSIVDPDTAPTVQSWIENQIYYKKNLSKELKT